jgi:hypothetical protein
MKNKLATIFTAALLSLSTSAFAEGPIVRNTLETFCFDRKTLVETLKQWKETPIFAAQSVRELNNRQITVTLIVFSNKEEGTWTMAEQYSENLFCVLGIGFEFNLISGAFNGNSIREEKKNEKGIRNIFLTQ